MARSHTTIRIPGRQCIIEQSAPFMFWNLNSVLSKDMVYQMDIFIVLWYDGFFLLIVEYAVFLWLLVNINCVVGATGRAEHAYPGCIIIQDSLVIVDYISNPCMYLHYCFVVDVPQNLFRQVFCFFKLLHTAISVH